MSRGEPARGPDSGTTTPRSLPFDIRAAGDSALVLELEARVDPVINAHAVDVAEAFRSDAHTGVRDVVSSYRSVTVYFDPLRANVGRLVEALERHAARVPGREAATRCPTVVPVCYGGAYGPDVEEVARFGGCSTAEVVRRHAGTVYRVYLLGFVPGFAYMGRVDGRIAMPRRQHPRLRVPAGSVGIAGVQTGIYPTETPGGWRVIGRTPLRPFDADRDEPFLFKPGDLVRFEPIAAAAYRAWDPDRAGNHRGGRS